MLYYCNPQYYNHSHSGRSGELICVAGRKHTSLDVAEADVWIFGKDEYARLKSAGKLPTDSFFVTNEFDPVELRFKGKAELPELASGDS